jgi:AcrR family transcriptional regulator
VPYPSQVDRDTIVAQAQQLIESEGLAALSLAKLAEMLGVKAPSLYRHIGHKVDLLRAVNLMTVEQLFATLHTARTTVSTVNNSAAPDPQAQLLAIFQAFRHFAHSHPQRYTLLFSLQSEGERPDEDYLAGLAKSIQSIVAEISGDRYALVALRGALALAHGYVMLELNRQLRRGGDLDKTFDQVIIAYLTGWVQIRRQEDP